MSEQQTAAPEAAQPVTEDQDPQTAPEAADEFDATRALEKIRKANAEAKSLRDRAKAAEEAKNAAEDKVKAAQEAAARIPELESRLLRAEVALELGIPASLAKRLVGGTREELLADAEELMATVAPKAGPKQVRPVESLQPGSGKAAEPDVDAQIAAASKAGNWRLALSLQNQKLASVAGRQ